MIQLDRKVINKTRKELFTEIRLCNIGVHVHYIPVYWHPYYQDLGYEKGLCAKAEEWYECAMTLHIFPGMMDEDVEDVVSTLKNVLEPYSKDISFN